MEDKYTDVMSEISVKNSLINHLERENIKLKERVEICKENHIRYDIKAIDENTELKAELEEMRNEYNIAQDGITDLNDVLKDMQEESKEQIKENKRLQAENETLKAENCGLINESKWDKNKLIKELQAENDSLKDEAVKWNRKHNKLENINEMKYSSLKEYKEEANEYFHHNPKCKGVRFHMLDYDEYEYNENDGLNGLSGEYNGSLLAEDCLLEVDNEGSSPMFH